MRRQKVLGETALEVDLSDKTTWGYANALGMVGKEGNRECEYGQCK